MDIFQLKEFKSLSGTLSYSETAYRLNVSTSALSRHIQQLEDELGGKLFDRTTRSISLTELGRVFLPHAVMIIQEYEDGMADVSQCIARQDHTFIAGTIYSIDEYDIGHYFNSFRSEHPDYTPIVTLTTMSDLEKGFSDGRFNMYSAVYDESIEGMEFFKMGEVSILAVVPADSKLAASRRIELGSLAGTPLLMPEEGSAYYRRTLSAIEKVQKKPHIIYKGRYEDSISFIRNGMGVGLFPFRKGVHVHGAAVGLAYLETDPEILFDYGIGYRKDLSPAESLFVRHIYEKSRDPEFLRAIESMN